MITLALVIIFLGYYEIKPDRLEETRFIQVK